MEVTVSLKFFDVFEAPTLSRPSTAVGFSVKYRGGQTIRGVLKEANFDGVASEISDKNFPFRKVGLELVSVRLFKLREDCFQEEIHLLLAKHECRPANGAEVLSLGVQYPHMLSAFSPVCSVAPSECLIRGGWRIRHTIMVGSNSEGWVGAAVVPYDEIYPRHMLIAGVELANAH